MQLTEFDITYNNEGHLDVLQTLQPLLAIATQLYTLNIEIEHDTEASIDTSHIHYQLPAVTTIESIPYLPRLIHAPLRDVTCQCVTPALLYYLLIAAPNLQSIYVTEFDNVSDLTMIERQPFDRVIPLKQLPFDGRYRGSMCSIN